MPFGLRVSARLGTLPRASGMPTDWEVTLIEPDDRMFATDGPVTRSRVRGALRELGVGDGAIVMTHARLSAIGYLPGGPQTLIDALMDALGDTGTLMVTCGWEYGLPYDFARWPTSWRTPILEECPAFDPATAPCDVSFGRFVEAVRGRPGAVRSNHPDASFAAIGRLAHELIDDAPLDDPHGPHSPLARLVAHQGQVLMLGAPLDTITLLHHAEAISDGEGKRFVEYEQPMLIDGHRTWRRFSDIDSEDGAYPYDDILDEDQEAFEVIAREFLLTGAGTRGQVGGADCYLLPANDLLHFAVGWLEAKFPRQSTQRPG